MERERKRKVGRERDRQTDRMRRENTRGTCVRVNSKAVKFNTLIHYYRKTQAK